MRGSPRRLIPIGAAVLAATVACAAAEVGTVVEVVDGDTLKVSLPGGTRTVRLLGIDTPEPGRSKRAPEFFGDESTAFTRRLAEGRTVRLEADPLSDDEDRYGRALRYVVLPDGRSLNAEILAGGFGQAYTRFPFSRLAEFRGLEREARESGRGMWDPASIERIAPEEAASRLGSIATVCGEVASTRHAGDANGKPTFLNLGRPHPRQLVAVVIWGADRVGFDEPEVRFRGARICVTGKIESYRGKLEIVVRDPTQIAIEPAP